MKLLWKSIPKKSRRGARRLVTQNKSTTLQKTAMSILASSRPTTYSANTNFKHRFRFGGGNGNYIGITRGMLLSIYLLGTGSSSGYRVLQGVKLDQIEIFTPSQNSSITSFCSIIWLSAYGPAIEKSDISVSSSYPAHILTSPPTRSLASFWSLAGSNESDVLFQINTPGSSIVDVWLSMTFADGPGTTVTTHNILSANNLYIVYLDGPNSGTATYPGIAVTTGY